MATETTTEFNPYDYNSRIAEINNMYDAYANSQKATLESQYQQNLNNMEANRNKIAQQYETQRNASAANYEQTRRNFNQQAMMNGLNTGAGSQAALAQNNMYNRGMATLGASEGAAYAELDRNIADLKVKYEADVNDAIAKNDYNRAAALLDEYNNAYSQAMTKAQQLAQYGDFSGYAALYGDDAARQMTRTWQIQNPLIAYNLGQLTAAQYKQITGSDPPGMTSASGGGGGGYYGRGGSSKSKKTSGSGDGLDLTPADYDFVNGGAGGDNGEKSSVSSTYGPQSSGNTAAEAQAARNAAIAASAAANQKAIQKANAAAVNAAKDKGRAQQRQLADQYTNGNYPGVPVYKNRK